MARVLDRRLLLVVVASIQLWAADTSLNEIRNVEVSPSGENIRVEVTLASPAVPSVELAHHPERLVLKFPGTVSDVRQKRISVARDGVRSIRFGLNQANPPETHLVIDLEDEHPYQLSTAGDKIIIELQPSLRASASHRKAPASAATKPLISSIGRGSGQGFPDGSTNSQGTLLTPPPSGPPIEFPQAKAETSSGVEREQTASSQQLPSTSGQTVAQTQQPAAATPTIDTQPNPAAPVPDAQASAEAQPGVMSPKAAEQSTANVPKSVADGSSGADAPQLTLRTGTGTDLRTAFRVKYVVEDSAYFDGGRAAGLTEGMKLVVRDLPNAGGVAAEGADSDAAGDVAELEILSVAETSAVTEVHSPKRPVKVGDLAYLSSADQQALVEKNALSATRKYPAVVSFTENDTLDDEARAEVPKPPLPSVNRARGRIGFDYMGVLNHGSTNMVSSNLGLVLRTDITRIGGTYWNVSGYWRGRFDHSTVGPQTLQDLINRTYHLYTSYDNPQSAWVAGFGRMYLPWATSLDTIDGGYVGRKIHPGVTSGVFLGSTPDPTSFSYDPRQQIGGAFVNFEGGSYEDLHYTSTAGGGLQMHSWSPNRPFVFFENGIFWRRVFSIYQASQIDSRQGYWYTTPQGQQYQPGTKIGIGRSFTTIRFQPHPRVEFSLNHSYYRDLPTFDPSLIGTGMLDKFLTQGFMGGTRVEVLKQIWLSADLGMSNRSGESKNSLNQMFGITFGRLPWIGLHADARYSRFTSTFGSGSYESLSFSRNLSESLQLQILAGQQNFASTVSSATRSRFVNGMLESSLGRHYFVQVGGTINRGSQMNYDQWLFTFGYRFDNHQGHRGQ